MSLQESAVVSGHEMPRKRLCYAMLRDLNHTCFKREREKQGALSHLHFASCNLELYHFYLQGVAIQ